MSEPTAWINKERDTITFDNLFPEMTPLYEKREWVGLTDEEKAQFVVAYYPSNWDRKTAVSLMNDYEKYLKEKNT